MSKTLLDTPLLEFVPSSIASDGQVQAAAKAIQPELDDISANIPFIELYSRLDELPDSILHMLAWENKMAGAEWALATTREDKINLVRNSFELNKRRGTRWSVERIFTLLRFRPEITEWWEDGDQPYTFKISVFDVAARGLKREQLGLIEQLIFAYKPLRAWLTHLGLTLSSEFEPVAIGAITQYGTMDVLPMGYGEKTVDFGYTAFGKGAITLDGVLEIGQMPFGEETVDYGLKFDAVRAISAKGVLDVGPQQGDGAATYIKFRIGRD